MSYQALSKLENLCMENSFTLWEVEGKSNASIAELKYLHHLTTLDIQIPDAKLLLTDVLFEKLIKIVARIKIVQPQKH